MGLDCRGTRTLMEVLIETGCFFSDLEFQLQPGLQCWLHQPSHRCVFSKGDKYQVLNMVSIGTTFQLVAVAKKGSRQCSSAGCLRILSGMVHLAAERIS